MLNIVFPEPTFTFRKHENKEEVWDNIRKKWVRLTPEEWVRQNFIIYLVNEKNYPASLLAIEKEIVLGEIKKRCDIVVYKNAIPWMIIECKQPGVTLTEATLMQAVRYNLANCCSYLIISNGNSSLGWQIENGTAKEITDIPGWQ